MTTPKKPAKKNTPAPAPAAVSATGGAQVPPQAAASSPVPTTVPSERKAPPVGEWPEATLTVTAKREGFRRAGRAWSVAATTVPAAELSEEQRAALLAEPMLDVRLGPAIKPAE